MVLYDETGLGQNGTTRSQDLFAAHAQAAFKDVEIDRWPQVRWWLPEGVATDRTLDKNLEEIYNSGFGGVEIIAIPEEGVDHTIYGWGSQEWNEHSRRVIKEATRRGLAFSLTSRAHLGDRQHLPHAHVRRSALRSRQHGGSSGARLCQRSGARRRDVLRPRPAPHSARKSGTCQGRRLRRRHRRKG